MGAIFLSETRQIRTQWSDMFIVCKEKKTVNLEFYT